MRLVGSKYATRDSRACENQKIKGLKVYKYNGRVEGRLLQYIGVNSVQVCVRTGGGAFKKPVSIFFKCPLCC